MSKLHWNKYNAAADLDPFPDIRYQCPLCYKSFKEEYDKCPNCGKVIKGESHYERYRLGQSLDFSSKPIR